MATLTPPPRTSSRQLQQPTRLTRWSLWMLPGFLAVFMLTSFAWLYLVFPMLGLKEGDIVLFAHSVGGWVAAVIGWALLVAAPVGGVVFAVKALRRGGRVGAWVGLVLNSLVTLMVAYMVFDEIRMAYFPQFTFPFSG
jgi:hypothetical protein